MVNIISIAVKYMFNLIEYAIFLDVILSWIMPGKSNKFLDILHIFTEPFLAPARKIQEKLIPGFMLDFSPIGALVILYVLQKVIYIILGFLL